MATALQTLTNKLADRFDMGDGTGLTDVLTNTAFRGQKVSQDQMTALLVVANQYGLNPWTNEVYAFPNNGGIVPIVGVDGWARIMNEHPQYDGMDFSFSEKAIAALAQSTAKTALVQLSLLNIWRNVAETHSRGNLTLNECYATRQ